MPPEMQLQMAPTQHIYMPNAPMDIIPADDGRFLLVVSIPGVPGEQIVFPMDADNARQLGLKMAAPHIAVVGAK